MNEAQHRIASAPIILIKKDTLPPGRHFHIGLYGMCRSSGYHFSVKILEQGKKFAKKILNRVGGSLIPVLLQFFQVLEESEMNLLAQAFFGYFPLLTKGVPVK